MHIPDGYLSPQTCAVATAVMVPVWGTAAHKVRQTIKLRRGLTEDVAKRISKLIRDEGPKGVKSQIQGDAVRVSGKNKDDLQKVIARLRELDEPVPLQFQNYR